MRSGFQITRMTLTLCQTASVRRSISYGVELREGGGGGGDSKTHPHRLLGNSGNQKLFPPPFWEWGWWFGTGAFLHGGGGGRKVSDVRGLKGRPMNGRRLVYRLVANVLLVADR